MIFYCLLCMCVCLSVRMYVCICGYIFFRHIISRGKFVLASLLGNGMFSSYYLYLDEPWMTRSPILCCWYNICVYIIYIYICYAQMYSNSWIKHTSSLIFFNITAVFTCSNVFTHPHHHTFPWAQSEWIVLFLTCMKNHQRLCVKCA